MCGFKSAIVTRPVGDEPYRIIHHDATDSHEHLIVWAGLRDDKPGEVAAFVRVEFAPADKSRMDDPDSYSLRLDEGYAPAWWTDELAARVAADMHAIVDRMIIREERPILLGGSYILAARVPLVVGSKILGVTATTDLAYANLRDANLAGANLRNANLAGANLAGASLRNASLASADLAGASLAGASLRNASLAGADLAGANLRNARYCEHTILPRGVDVQAAGAICVQC